MANDSLSPDEVEQGVSDAKVAAKGATKASTALAPVAATSSGFGLVTENSPESAADMSKYLTKEELKLINDATQANVNPDELQISRLAIIQAKSPELDKRPKEPGYDEGQIVDNYSRQIYSVKALPPWMRGKVPDDKLEPVDLAIFVPIFKLPSEYIRWKDRNTEGKGQWWKTLDPHEKLDIGGGLIRPAVQGTFKGGWKAAEDAQKKSPPVTDNTNILGVIIRPDGELLSPYLIATFAKTNAQVGQKFVNALQRHRMHNLPYFGLAYYIYSVFEPGKGKGSYWRFEIQMAGRVPNNENLLNSCKFMAGYLANPITGKENQEGLLIRSHDSYDEETDDGSGNNGSDHIDANVSGGGEGEPAF